MNYNSFFLFLLYYICGIAKFKCYEKVIFTSFCNCTDLFSFSCERNGYQYRNGMFVSVKIGNNW